MFESTYNPINLIYAKSPEYSATSAYYIEGYVLIQKCEFSKKVVIHYTYDHKHWFICYAAFLTTTNNNHEVWYFKTPSTNSHNSCSFALCYKDCHDKEYWDNNQSMNYNLKWYSPTKVFNRCVIVLDKTFKNPNKFYGSILIKNISYQKTVKVKLSFNNWETSTEVDAINSSQLTSSLENWTFSIPISLPCEIKFVVYCIVNGITYFDNNFGMGYFI